MNIFLKVLKTLIGNELTTAASKQNSKSNGYGYNKQLSADQQNLIAELNKSIILYDPSEDDSTISTDIGNLIKGTHKAIKKLRDEHKTRTEGETLPALIDLKNRVPEFYEKLKSFNFKLLNKPFTETPEGIVYYYAALYLGEQIFCPSKYKVSEVKKAKEDCLCDRLQQLSDLIKPDHKFEDRKKHTMTILHDLARDNKEIVNEANSSNYINLPLPIGGLNFLGAKVSLAQVFGCSLGRFGELFNEAVRRINKMSPKAFELASSFEADNNNDSDSDSEAEHKDACVI